METSQPTTPPVYVKPATTGVFGTKIPSTVAFAVGILLFAGRNPARVVVPSADSQPAFVAFGQG